MNIFTRLYNSLSSLAYSFDGKESAEKKSSEKELKTQDTFKATDADGPGAGGGYKPSDVDDSDSDGPGAGGGYKPADVDDTDGPGAGGGYKSTDVDDSDGPGAGGGYDFKAEGYLEVLYPQNDGPGAGGGYDGDELLSLSSTEGHFTQSWDDALIANFEDYLETLPTSHTQGEETGEDVPADKPLFVDVTLGNKKLKGKLNQK